MISRYVLTSTRDSAECDDDKLICRNPVQTSQDSVIAAENPSAALALKKAITYHIVDI